ncbi:MAG: 4Fe-4S dicluster domain-containing protein [Treponema sp.]|nr:4Fe-4S dicluster domain-containing protein [Treponema sp.]
MLSISTDKINALFEAIAKSEKLYIPVDSDSGKANFEAWEKGKKLSEQLKTVRSAKDFFFPKTEHMVSYKMNGKEITVEDPRKDVEDFVVFGVRACDAASFAIIDGVYLKMNPVDSYYKNRREHGTVITLACNAPAQTCFCSTYKIDAANPAGDVSCWNADGKYFFNANTDKGKKLLDSVKEVLSDSSDNAVEELKKEITGKIEKLPFAHLDLSKFKGKDMMKIFNSKIWDKVAEPCIACGTCTYICPTCMCFDVRDFNTGKGIRQVRCWDSCMYSDFTQMAAANPRLTQKERSRQRFMHKLMYYPMAHEDVFSCVGCGRCLESCPVNMNIVKVIKAVQESDDI